MKTMNSKLLLIGALFALVAIVVADVTDIQQTTEEPSVEKIHVLNPGEKEFLSPNLIGLQNIAITHIPANLDFINIIDAYREVLDGVRYEIVLNAANRTDNNTEIICRLIVIEKPWLTTFWGDKVRLLRESNCTSEELVLDTEDRKAIEDKYETNAIFTGNRNDLTADDMSRLESQIISEPNPQLKKHHTFAATTESNAILQQEQVTESLPSAIKDSTRPGEEQPAESTDVAINNEETNSSPSEEDLATSATEKISELSDNEKKWLDDLLSVGAYNFETSLENKRGQNEASNQDEHEIAKRAKRAVPIDGAWQLDSEELLEARDALGQSLATLATGSGPYYTIERVYSGTKQVGDGTLIKLDCNLQNIQTGEKKRCTISLWARPWLKEDGYELTFDCPNKEITFYRHSKLVKETAPTTPPGPIGGPRPLNAKQLQEQQLIFQGGLDKLATGEEVCYSIVKVISGTSQVVSGSLVKLKAELYNSSSEQTQTCDLSLWSQPWLPNGYQLTINCPNQPPITYTY